MTYILGENQIWFFQARFVWLLSPLMIMVRTGKCRTIEPCVSYIHKSAHKILLTVRGDHGKSVKRENSDIGRIIWNW